MAEIVAFAVGLLFGGLPALLWAISLKRQVDGAYAAGYWEGAEQFRALATGERPRGCQ